MCFRRSINCSAGHWILSGADTVLTHLLSGSPRPVPPRSIRVWKHVKEAGKKLRTPYISFECSGHRASGHLTGREMQSSNGDLGAEVRVCVMVGRGGELRAPCCRPTPIEDVTGGQDLNRSLSSSCLLGRPCFSDRYFLSGATCRNWSQHAGECQKGNARHIWQIEVFQASRR